MITDVFGDRIDIAVTGSEVVLYLKARDGDPMVFLNAAQRDQFAKAWAEAERRAEAHAGRRDGHGEADGG